MTSRPQTSARQKIAEQMERMRPTFTLMYCSEDPNEAPASFKYENRPFKLLPMQKITVTDLTGVPIGKAYDYSLGPTQPRPWRTKDTGRGPKERVTIAAAEKVVSHGLGLLWRRGVVMLTGSTGDAAEIESGKVLWRAWRQQQDENIVGAFHKRMEDFISDPRNKHLPRPLMGKLEREAQSRLDGFRLGAAGLNYTAGGMDAMRCPHEDCAYWSDDKAELERHALASHGGEAPTITAESSKAQDEREQRRKTKREQELAAKRAQILAEAAEEPPAIIAALGGEGA